jgi:prepilin-type N-terminal cleavage/methylation domain-containing protein
MRASRIGRGFTLVELLVVIAIIGVLVALLLPAVQAAREAARRSSCSNNLKQLALGLHNYHDTYKVFPFGHHFRGIHDGDPADADGGSGFGWGTAILPFIEQQPLYDKFVLTRPITDNVAPVQNLTLAQTHLPGFACPSDTKPKQRTDGAVTNSATSSYKSCGTAYDGWQGGIVGANPNPLRFNGLFDRDNRGEYGMNNVLDGTSNTFAVAEAKWKMDINERNRGRIFGATDTTAGTTGATNALMVNGQWQMNWTAQEGNLQPHRTAASNHPGGAQFALIDGSVRFVSETIQHTAAPWIDNPNAFDRPNNGAGYGLYQRLFSVDDGLVIGNY